MRIPQHEHGRLPIQCRANSCSRLQLPVDRDEFVLKITELRPQALPVQTFKEARVAHGFDAFLEHFGEHHVVAADGDSHHVDRPVVILCAQRHRLTRLPALVHAVARVLLSDTVRRAVRHSIRTIRTVDVLSSRTRASKSLNSQILPEYASIQDLRIGEIPTPTINICLILPSDIAACRGRLPDFARRIRIPQRDIIHLDDLHLRYAIRIPAHIIPAIPTLIMIYPHMIDIISHHVINTSLNRPAYAGHIVREVYVSLVVRYATVGTLHRQTRIRIITRAAININADMIPGQRTTHAIRQPVPVPAPQAPHRPQPTQTDEQSDKTTKPERTRAPSSQVEAPRTRN